MNTANNIMLDFESAKILIRKIADGIATEQEESTLEEYARQEWGHHIREKDVIVLLHNTPRGGGQSHYRSMRSCIESNKNIAANWRNTLHIHQLVGTYIDQWNKEPVYAYEYTEKIEQPSEGNYVEISCWGDEDEEIETLIRFACAEGLVKDVGDDNPPKQDQKMYIFDSIPSCTKCATIKNIQVLCTDCIARAIAAGNCTPML